MATVEASAEAVPSAPVRGAAGLAPGTWTALAVLAAVTLAVLPWIWFQGRVLWGLPHYQFAVLIPFGAAVLLARDVRGLGLLGPGSRWVTAGLLAGSGLVLVMADLFYSPMLGTVAALLALLAVAHGVGGARLVRAVLPAWAFLWVLVRPPLDLDRLAIDRLQGVATRWSGAVLDLLGVVHVTAGNVIEVPGRRLLIEEACSGAHSLLVALAAAFFAALIWKLSWPRGLLLAVAAAVWVLLGNVIRIVTVGLLAERRGINVGEGWRHEALGFVILLTMLGLLASTDQVTRRLLALLGRIRNRFRLWRAERVCRAELQQMRLQGATRQEMRALVAATAGLAGNDPVREPESPTRPPDWRETWLGSRRIVMVVGLIGLAQVVIVRRGQAYSAPVVDQALERLSAEVLPEHFGPFRRVGFEVKQGGIRSVRGEAVTCWTYRSAGASAFLAVNHPYLGWHELTACYKAQGWQVDARQVEPARIGIDGVGPCVGVRLSQPPARFGRLWFAFYDGSGRALTPPSGGPLADLRERLDLALRRSMIGPRGEDSPTYVVQLMLETDDPLSPRAEAEARAFFDHARATFHRTAEARTKP